MSPSFPYGGGWEQVVLINSLKQAKGRATLKILVSNDDGIYAQGLWTLVRELTPLGEVIVVAPDREQSGVGTAMTLHHPLRVTQVVPQVEGVKAYCVEGTPADSIIFALGALDNKVDILFSGINEGSNLGNDVIISGTVGAALQGYFRGLPSIALSMTAIENLHFEVAARLGAFIARSVANNALPRDILLNINVPNLPIDKIEGIRVTRLARRSYTEILKEGHDGKRNYYWIVRGKPEWSEDEGTDIWAVRHNSISVTPLHNDMTAFTRLDLVAALCPSLWEGLRLGGAQPQASV